MVKKWLVYGANGYTGEQIAREAARRGDRPILAGRNQQRLEELAKELDCEFRVFSLDQPESLLAAVQDVSLVLNCAGPFSKTARPWMDACLKRECHYLDITGEIEVIEWAAQHHAQAQTKKIVLMPAVGFDVVPSDCLATALAARIENPVQLQLAFAGMDHVSLGTARTVLESLPEGGKIRKQGELTSVPTAWKSKEISFAHETQWAMTLPWGDVASAFYSTGIPNIEVLAGMPRQQIAWIRRLRFLLPVLRLKALQNFVASQMSKAMAAPQDLSHPTGKAQLWGRVSNAQGEEAEATLTTPEAYFLTVQTALASVQKVLASDLAGYYTPAMAFGSGFITEITGSQVQFR